MTTEFRSTVTIWKRTHTRKDGTRRNYWTATVRPGRDRRKSESRSHDTENEARQWAKALQNELQAGESSRTLNEALDEYIDDQHFRGLRAQAVRLQHLEYWRNEMGAKRLARITDADIQTSLRKLAGNGSVRNSQPLSPTTVNRYRASLSAALEFARRELRWIDVNPVGLTGKRREPRGRTRFLTDDERGRLLDACRTRHDLYLMVLLALTTGARQGEILAARWSHFGLKARTWHIPPANTKTGEPRLLPLAAVVVAELKKLVRRLPPADYLFPHRSDPRKRAYFPETPWRNAREAAELKDFRFHDLRHTAASYLAQNGASTRQLADMLGHKTLAMVQRYSHLTVDSRRELVDFLNDKVSS